MEKKMRKMRKEKLNKKNRCRDVVLILMFLLFIRKMEYYEAQAQKLEQTIEPQTQMRFSNMFDIKEFWQIFVKYLIQRFVNEKNKDEIQVKNAQTDEDNNTRIMKELIIIRLRQAVC